MSKMKKKRFTVLLVSLMPFNRLRIFLYNLFFGYKISADSKIGFGVVIHVESVQIKKAIIKPFNLFDGPFSLEMAENSRINSFNWVECGFWTLQEKFKDINYKRFCRLRKNSLVHSTNFIDATDGFDLGADSWVARGCQFWTHTVSSDPHTEKNVRIGKNCYIGSASRFVHGSGLGDNILVGVGSVVTKRFDKGNCMIAGVPAKVIKEDYDWKSRTFLQPTQ
jgi:acetyltransferase-like isoleucine patch superfamily enzyme